MLTAYLDFSAFNDGSVKFFSSNISGVTWCKCYKTKSLKKWKTKIHFVCFFLCRKFSSYFWSTFIENDFSIDNFTELLKFEQKHSINQIQRWIHLLSYFKHCFEIVITKSKWNIRNMKPFLCCCRCGCRIWCNNTIIDYVSCWLWWMWRRWIRMNL